jgi:hypothetical protein
MMWGLMTLCPPIAGMLFLLPHWWRIEKTGINRLKTFALILLQVWPQYRVLRILYLGLWRKDNKAWREERGTMDKDISSIGRELYSTLSIGKI